MNKPLADYVKLPGFDEYKEWFKAFADLKREDGIVQVTWKTNDWRYCHDWMQQPPTRESWAGFRTKPIEWFKEVEAGREVNPFDPKRPVKPYRPEPADGSSK